MRVCYYLAECFHFYNFHHHEPKTLSLLLNRMILLTTVTIVAVQLQGGVFIIEQYDIVVLPFIIGAV